MSVPRPERSAVRPAFPVRVVAWIAVRLWWVVLPLVGVGVYLAVTMLPTLATAGGGLSGLIGEENQAVEAQVRAARLFGLPLLTRTAVVQHDPDGLAPDAVARSLQRAATVDQPAFEGRPTPPLLLALPVPNGSPGPLPVVPGFDPQDFVPQVPLRPATTVVTYLFIDPSLPIGEQQAVSQRYADSFDQPGDAMLGVSGTVPLQVAQGELVSDNLRYVEIFSVLAVAVVVGLLFRSFLAPLVTLVAAALSYLVADHLVGLAADSFGLTAPGQLEPVLVALALGVSTDYSILFMSGMERRLREGSSSREAARGAVFDYLTIVVVAGVTVAAGVASLTVARTSIFQAFGPGLAITVLASLAVSVLVVPTSMAMFGRAAFWPRLRKGSIHPAAAQELDRGRSRFVRLITRHRVVAAGASLLALGVLIWGALPLANLQQGVSPMSAIPADNQVRVAYQGAADGFAPGVLSPTEVIVSAPGLAARGPALARLQAEIQGSEGVAGVVGPATLPGAQAEFAQRTQGRFNLFVGPRGDAVRFLVVFDADPLGATAIDHLRELDDRLPDLARSEGLPGVGVAVAGDTALGLELVESARGDFWRIALVVAAVDLVLLMLFLRSLVAPFYLLACSLLVVGTALGLTSLAFGGLDGLIFFVPFAVGALLASLGADYNIFGVGDVWHASEGRTLSEALRVAVPRSTRAIGAAGITLAASFGFVALIPVAAFHELAFAMAVGVLMDTFIVRAFLVPALIWWVGPVSAWPSRRLYPRGGRRRIR